MNPQELNRRQLRRNRSNTLGTSDPRPLKSPHTNLSPYCPPIKSTPCCRECRWPLTSGTARERSSRRKRDSRHRRCMRDWRTTNSLLYRRKRSNTLGTSDLRPMKKLLMNPNPYLLVRQKTNNREGSRWPRLCAKARSRKSSPRGGTRKDKARSFSNMSKSTINRSTTSSLTR